jgi:hypothetical protein
MDTCGKANFLNVVGPMTELRAGEMAEFEVKVTAHHKGHFVFRLCDQALSSHTGGLQNEEECLNKHVLKRARPKEVHGDCQPNDQRGDCQPYDEATDLPNSGIPWRRCGRRCWLRPRSRCLQAGTRS